MPNSLSSHSSTAIVLCTYNGEKHLRAQIESLLIQSSPCTVLAFDDGSSDSTVAILREYESDTFRIHQNQSNLGYVKNFESGIHTALNAGFEFIALADQDDLWDDTRIEDGITIIQSRPNSNMPTLVHSDLRVIDDQGSLIAASYFAMRNYRINHAHNLEVILGQNGVMGNSILMNSALAKLALPFPEHLHVHDYWIAILSELYGQRILLDSATLQYRLHTGNASNNASKFNRSKLGSKDTSFIERLRKRDFRLPFKEDSRESVIRYLLADNPLPPLKETDAATLEQFVSYLRSDGSTLDVCRTMLSSDYLNTGVIYRLRFILTMFFSRRYD